MAKWANGLYTPKNPEKYIGAHTPRYRSSWEYTFMTFADTHQGVLYWASEPIKIPYKNPITGKATIYIPDFFVVYTNKFGQHKAEVVEIKPKNQSLQEAKTSARNKLIIAVNHAKWAAASRYCQTKGYEFRVITEVDLYRQASPK